MIDLIDRQAAIDALVEEKGIINGILDSLMLGIEARKKWEQIRGRLSDDIEIIAKLPSVEPERKTGRWRRRLVDSGFNADWHCSECGWKTSLEVHWYNFCPNCGARMEEAK